MKGKIEKLGKVSITVEKDYWDKNKAYNRLTIVERQGTSTAYLSRKAVPIGIDITDRNYWITISKWSDIPYEIVQEFGDSPELVISQKVVTLKVNELQGLINNINDIIGEGGSIDERIEEEGAKHYTKEETYSKTELNNLITTPDQQYVSVDSYQDLPDTGSADTIYRVGGTTSYREYAWNGTDFVLLSEKNVGIDDKPTAGSDNLVKSGGVANAIAFNSYLETEMSQGNNINYYINLNGIWSWQQDGGHKIISVKPGEEYRVYAADNSIALYLWLQSSDVSANNPASISNVDGSRHIVEMGCFSDGVVPSDAHYMYLHSNVSGTLAPKKVCRLQLIANEVEGLSKEVAENVNLAKNGIEIGFNEGIIASSTGVVVLPSPDNITSEYIIGGNTIVVKAGYYIKRVGQYDIQTEAYTLYGNYNTEQRFVHLIDGYKYRVTVAHIDSSDISPNEDVLEPFTHSNFHYLNSIDNSNRFKPIIIAANGNLVHSSTDRTLIIRIGYENQLFIARYYLSGSLANRGIWIGDTKQGSNIRRISSSATAGWHSDIYRATASDVGKYIFICGEHNNGRAVAVGYVSNGAEYFADASTLSKEFLTILHLDCGRKYFSVNNIKTMLLKASQSGYSTMSLYFSDNQGFRFGLDDMNIIINNTTYDLAVALGDGITTSSPQGDKSPDGTDKWLTQSDMDDIISYANSLGIEIMPAFDMPGHMGAILDSFPQFKYPNNDVDINLKDELSVNFALAIMEKYVAYFASRGCRYYNFCGDEVKYIATLYANDEMYYYNDFIEKASRIIMSEGMIPVAFNEGLYYGGVDNNTNTNIISSYWAHYTHYASVKEQASMGVRLINTNSSYYYVLGISGPTESQLNEFNIHKFAGNQYFYNPIGACFCIWCDKGDYHGADEGDTLTPIILPLIEAFGITVSMQV